MTNNLIFGICIIIAAMLIGDSYYESKKLDNIRNMTIEVKGYASKDITSDFADWTGSFSVRSESLQDAYVQIQNVQDQVKKQIITFGTKENELEFSSIQTRQIFRQIQGEYGYQNSDDVIAYELTQTIFIESKDIELIEKIAKLSTNLISEGINFNSYSPRYFYTKIDDLKLEMLSEATKDAKNRAEHLADNTDADVGNLISASQGVFQITSKNSQEVSSYGIYDTHSKEKTISAVITAQFEVK